MQWPQLHPVGAESVLPQTLKTEAESITRAVEEIVGERVKVDQAETEHESAYRADAAHDRTPYLKAVVAVLEREIVLRQRIEVFYVAKNQVFDELHGAAQENLGRVVAEIAQSFEIIPPQHVPIAVLQGFPHWWDARRQLEGVPIDSNQTSREAHTAMLHAEKLLTIYQREIGNEADRLEQLVVAQKEAEAHAARLARQETARMEPRETLMAKVNRLLGRAGPADDQSAEAVEDVTPGRRGRKISIKWPERASLEEVPSR